MRTIKPNKQQRKLARLLVEHPELGKCEAARRAGYTPAQAKKGIAGWGRGVAVALQELEQQFPPRMRAALIRGRLIQNLLEGHDKSVQSAKLLGSDRELDMFRPDFQTGVITLVMPESLAKVDVNAPCLEDEILEPPEPK